MANTYTQLYIQLVFAVKGRNSLIKENFRIDVEKYMTAMVQNHSHKLLAIYCMPDHCHLFVGLSPKQSISNLVRTIKSDSTKWINEQGFLKSKFAWQEGFGAFSYSKSQKKAVINYVLQQPEHHKKTTFREEYLDFLQKFEVDYNEKYLFDWIERE